MVAISHSKLHDINDSNSHIKNNLLLSGELTASQQVKSDKYQIGATATHGLLQYMTNPTQIRLTAGSTGSGDGRNICFISAINNTDTATAHILDTNQNITNLNAKLLSIRNLTAEKTKIYSDGTIENDAKVKSNIIELKPISEPETATNGDIIYSNTENKFKFYQNNEWKELGGAIPTLQQVTESGNTTSVPTSFQNALNVDGKITANGQIEVTYPNNTIQINGQFPDRRGYISFATGLGMTLSTYNSEDKIVLYRPLNIKGYDLFFQELNGYVPIGGISHNTVNQITMWAYPNERWGSQPRIRLYIDESRQVILDNDGIWDTSFNPTKPKIYEQDTEPTIPNNCFAFWRDTANNKTYIILNYNGTNFKTEMT